jgi:protease I
MTGAMRRDGGSLDGARIAVLIESDYFEPEIHYYERRFAEEGAEVRFLTRLWGQPTQTFTGHEWRAPFVAERSCEDVSLDELRSYAAVIVPSGMVSDRLRYTEDVDTPSPATRFVARAFAEPGILKGVICHGMWLLATVPHLVRGRPVTCHNNLVGDVRNMGARYVDRDVVVDGDLVTGRTGQHAHLFARQIIDLLAATRSAAPPAPTRGAPTRGAPTRGAPARGAETRGALA